jgi:hypothetical protein
MEGGGRGQALLVLRKRSVMPALDAVRVSRLRLRVCACMLARLCDSENGRELVLGKEGRSHLSLAPHGSECVSVRPFDFL